LLFKKNPSDKEKIQSKVYSALAIPLEKKLCLYGPTFRDNGSLLPYDLPYEKLLQALSKRFGGEWVILTRFHPRTKKMIEGLSFPEGVVSASAYPDIAELMYCADAGITDYSSWICEYIHTRRPGFLFATDIASYDSERGFYDPLDRMPFPLAKNSDELIERILAFDEKEFLIDIDSFLKKKGCVDDGCASERIVDLVAGLI
jgi:CDP-glycerol glycerophosphotransferase